MHPDRKPTLGFTLAEIYHAQNKPILMVPQLLKIKSCEDYAETPYKLWTVYM